MQASAIHFYFDFSSPYSYIASEWIEALAARHGRTLRLSPGQEIPFPETIQALVAARLDALLPERKALVQDAAVVGKVFWSGALAAISGRDEPAL